MKIQMVDVVGQYQKIKPEIDAAVHRVLDSGQFINGKDVGDLETAVAGYLGVKHAVACASGTDALQIAMMALGIGPGDEVISTPFTFVATAETIAILGAKPVYVDIDPRTFNIFGTCSDLGLRLRFPFRVGLLALFFLFHAAFGCAWQECCVSRAKIRDIQSVRRTINCWTNIDDTRAVWRERGCGTKSKRLPIAAVQLYNRRLVLVSGW